MRHGMDPSYTHRLAKGKRSLGLALLVCLLATFWAAPAWAQKGTLAPDPWITILSNTGVIVPSACVWTYQAGTTTPVATYADVNLTSANTNPVIADVAGRVLMYLTPTQSYKFTVEQACTPPAHGATIRTQDNIAAVPASALTVPFADDFRLTLTSGTAVTTTDVLAATTLYLAQYVGNRITLFDGSCNPTLYNTGQLSIAVPATTSQMYDVWVYANAGIPTLELLAWTADTVRATALGTCNGRLVKSTDTTRLYVGSIRTTNVSGQTEDSVVKRLLWNYYNRVRRYGAKVETTTNWSSTNNSTWRNLNGNAANAIDIVIGVVEEPIYFNLNLVANSTATGVATGIGLGVDLNNAIVANLGGAGVSVVAAQYYQMFAQGSYLPVSPGRHIYLALENGQTGGTTTFYGSTLGTFFATSYQPGIFSWHSG